MSGHFPEVLRQFTQLMLEERCEFLFFGLLFISLLLQIYNNLVGIIRSDALSFRKICILPEFVLFYTTHLPCFDTFGRWLLYFLKLHSIKVFFQQTLGKVLFFYDLLGVCLTSEKILKYGFDHCVYFSDNYDIWLLYFLSPCHSSLFFFLFLIL